MRQHMLGYGSDDSIIPQLNLLMGSVGLLLLAIAHQVPVLTMVGGAVTVLLTAGLTTITVTRTIIRRLITI
jgi:hypothetical protein